MTPLPAAAAEIEDLARFRQAAGARLAALATRAAAAAAAAELPGAAWIVLRRASGSNRPGLYPAWFEDAAWREMNRPEADTALAAALPFCRHLDESNTAAWHAVTERGAIDGYWYLSIAGALAAAVPPVPAPPGVLWQATREMAGACAGRPVTEQEAARITAAIPGSTIPEALGDVVAAVTDPG